MNIYPYVSTSFVGTRQKSKQVLGQVTIFLLKKITYFNSWNEDRIILTFGK